MNREGSVGEVAGELDDWLETRGFEKTEEILEGQSSLRRRRDHKIGVEILVDQSDFMLISLTLARDWTPLFGVRSWAQCLGLRAPDESRGWKLWSEAEKIAWAMESSALVKEVVERLAHEPGGELAALAECAGRRNEEYWRLGGARPG